MSDDDLPPFNPEEYFRLNPPGDIWDAGYEAAKAGWAQEDNPFRDAERSYQIDRWQAEHGGQRHPSTPEDPPDSLPENPAWSQWFPGDAPPPGP